MDRCTGKVEESGLPLHVVGHSVPLLFLDAGDNSLPICQGIDSYMKKLIMCPFIHGAVEVLVSQSRVFYVVQLIDIFTGNS